MTSANVTEYTIKDLSGNKVGEHQQHYYCKTHWGDLLKFTPEENFTIQAWGYDEEEELWQKEEINLKTFLDKLRQSKYTQWNTWEDLKVGVKK